MRLIKLTKTGNELNIEIGHIDGVDSKVYRPLRERNPMFEEKGVKWIIGANKEIKVS